MARLEIEGNAGEMRLAVDDSVYGIELKPYAAPPWAEWKSRRAGERRAVFESR